jgi:endoglucanase
VTGSEFVRADGRRLIVGGEELRLRGIMPSFDPARVSGRDYEEIGALGLNAITLPLSARDFYAPEAPRDYQPRAWEWIDAHLALARRHRLFVTIQLLGVEGAHFVPDREVPYDFRIWEDERIQANTIALWRAIAARYEDEPTVAGYSLFPEPVCAGTVEQWHELAGALARAIREVDGN